MRIGIACGGTGGHIFPGLATAEALRRRGHAVILWLAGKDVERTAVDGWPGPVEVVRVSGLAPLYSWRNAAILWRLWRGVGRCREAMLRHQPEVLLAMGSYASLAPVWAAHSLGIPVVLHEANVIPGRAIRFLGRWAAAVALAFDETRRHLKHRRLVTTGMPLRSGNCKGVSEYGSNGVQEGTPESPAATANLQPNTQHLKPSSPSTIPPQSSTINHQPSACSAWSAATAGRSTIPPSPWDLLQDGVFTVLIMGGSRGAHRLNEIAAAALIRLHKSGRAVQAIHLTGLADEQTVRRSYAEAGLPHAVFGFLHDMPEAYRRASLAICRSGSSTCAELGYYGIAALLVPFPFATGQHQLANARALAAAGAAEIRTEPELDVASLAEYISVCMAEPDRLERMRQAARRRQAGDAAEALAGLVEDVGRGK